MAARPPTYEALRGGNYREGGKVAVAGETYDDIPGELVADLTARRAIKPLTGPVPETKTARSAGKKEVTADA